jgi:hypothetical protein
MTGEEIRAEVFREVLWRTSYHCSHTGPWDEALDACRDCHRIAMEVVDGLAAKGLLSIGIETGWRCDDYKGCCPDGEGEPCAYTSNPDVVRKMNPPAPLFRRYFTDWQETK